MLKKIWMFDTVALSNFLLADSVFLLEERYGNRALITWQVYDELSSGFAAYPPLEHFDEMIENKIFRLITMSKRSHKIYLGLIGHLGKGEASCIASARAHSGVVVTDDRAARKKCRQLDIPITGTIGILKASVLAGQANLAAADKYLEKMIKAGFYSPVLRISDIV